MSRPVAIDIRQLQDGAGKKGLHRPRLSAIIPISRPPALILIAAPFSSRLSRYTADRIGTACWDHALDLETEPEKWQRLLETIVSRKPFRDFVYRGMSTDGSPMYVRASGKPVFDAHGEFRAYRGACTDVTEIMRAQEALRESERSSRSTIDGIAGLAVIMAPNGEIETVNRQVFEYFGQSLEELKNWGTGAVVHPEDLPHVVELFKRAIASGNPYHIDQRLRRFDGEYRSFDTRGVQFAMTPGALRAGTGY